MSTVQPLFAQNHLPLELRPRPSLGEPAASRIFLLHAKDHSGHPAYYFMQAHPLRLPQFKKAAASGVSFDLEEYGEILASGYGEATQEVRKSIHHRYGWQG